MPTWSSGCVVSAFPADLLSNPNRRPVLQINYEGDVARIYSGSHFIARQFLQGHDLGARPSQLAPAELAKGLDLKILPLRSDTPLFTQNSARPTFGANGEVLKLKDVSIVWDSTLS